MWYSFLGAVLTVLFGLLISLITDCIATTQINSLSAHQHPDAEKPGSPAGLAAIDPFHKECEPVFILDKFRKTSAQHQRAGKNLNGYDNAALET